MKTFIKNILLYLLLVTAMTTAGMMSSYAQGFHTEFGKSKIQYEKFGWYFYRTKTFEVYYHEGGKNLAQYVLTHADKFLENIEKEIDYSIGDRITIVIYNTYSDYRQSNITLVDDQYNTGGLTPIVDNIAFVYFDGNHYDFNKRIKAAITEVILNELLYGSNIQQRIQNAALINLPEWYYNSLVKYIANEWSTDEQEMLNNGITSEKFKKFGKLSYDDKLLIGYSIWEYVDKMYGKGALANMLYMTHINKNIESGFNYVVGKSFIEVYNDWYKHTRYKTLSKETDKFQEIESIESIKRFGKKSMITNIRLSPKGDKIAYVSNKEGKAKVYVYDLTTGKKRKIFKTGYKKQDYYDDNTYPIVDWHPRDDKLTVIYEKKSVPRLFDYDLEKNKKENKKSLDRLDKILDFDYDNRGTNIVLSAIRNGSSDIFVFQMRSNRLFPITNDIYDDLNPRFIKNSSAIVFSSNRTSLDIKRRLQNPEKSFNPSFDIFYYDYKRKAREFKRVTFTPDINEFAPNAYDSVYISYLTDENSIINRDAAKLDSVFKHIRVTVSYEDTSKFKNDTFYFRQNDLSIVEYEIPFIYDSLIAPMDTSDMNFPDSLEVPYDTQLVKETAKIFEADTQVIYKDTSYTYRLTNYPVNIQAFDIRPRAFTMLELFQTEGKYQLSIRPTPIRLLKNRTQRLEKEKIYKEFKRKSDNKNLIQLDDSETKEEPKDYVQYQPKTPDTFRYYFLNDFDIRKIDTAENKQQTRDRIFFRDDEVKTPDEKDLKKRYSRTRFGSSSMYFMSFTPDYLVSQLDNSYLQNPYLPYDGTLPITPFNKATNAFIMLGVSDLFKDYKVSGGFRLQSNLKGAEYLMTFENLKKRLDKKVIFYRKGLVTDVDFTRTRQLTNEGRIQLSYPFQEYSSIRGDFFIRQDRKVTLSSERNSLRQPDVVTTFAGSKLEYVYDNTMPLGKNILEGTRMKIYFENYRNITNFKNVFSVYGLDFRNYVKIHKQIIWANRLAFASSFGEQKIVYFLGGVDNWLFPKINSDIQVDPEVNYIYKSLAANMRGFTQNIRNGNSYALINSEIRIPVIKYFSNRPLKNAFWENFQIVAFADIGTAWTGLHPYAEDNSLNKKVIEKNPFIITITTVGEPIVGGYGFGLRTELFGYFIKIDHAWGLEGGDVFDEITYISLGLDF